MLNTRSIDILKHIIHMFVETGEPVGSLAISHKLSHALSSATIRNIMAQLEDLGYLYSPHPSAGRLPTDQGLRYFVNELVGYTTINEEDRHHIEKECGLKGLEVQEVLNNASALLSELSQCVGLVASPAAELALKHVEFVPLDAQRALMVMVNEGGTIENRLMEVPCGYSSEILTEASNYLNAHLAGHTLKESYYHILEELRSHRDSLDQFSADLVKRGLDMWAKKVQDPCLIIHGQANLLQQVEHMEDLASIKNIFSLVEHKESLVKLLEASMKGQGIQIFIGAENEWFRHGGCSLVISPYENAQGKIVGALGIIGPTRIDYGRIIPLVDYTAKIISRLLK